MGFSIKGDMIYEYEVSSAYYRKEHKMVAIEYSGIGLNYTELVNSEEFSSILKNRPNLRLVTVDEDDDGNEIFDDVTLPLSEDNEDYVAVIDTETDAFMWVFYDDYASVYNPNSSFIEVLKVMDSFSKETFNERLFVAGGWGLVVDDEPVLSAEYDFEKGDYIL